jgi:hypothetical protein
MVLGEVYCVNTYISSGSSVRLVSDYRLDDRGSILSRGKEVSLQRLCPDLPWGPPNLLSSGYRGSLLLG